VIDFAPIPIILRSTYFGCLHSSRVNISSISCRNLNVRTLDVNLILEEAVVKQELRSFSGKFIVGIRPSKARSLLTLKSSVVKALRRFVFMCFSTYTKE
jgi:hypothetical protein